MPLIGERSPLTLGCTTYVYDPAGNRVAQQSDAGPTTICTYDAANQLVSRTGPSSSDVTTYVYDAAGNVLSERLGLPTTYTYDAENRLVSKASSADSDANASRSPRPRPWA